MNVNIDGIEYAPKSPVCAGDHRLGPLLKVTRKAIGYSLDEAAKHIGTSKAYLWKLENGRCEPSLRIAANIASAYGMRVETLAAALTAIVARVDSELMALEDTELAAEWYWRWEEGRSVEWNTYKFSDILELHKRRWRRWEEHHNGSCCVVERVRDKYVMPRVREFLAALCASDAPVIIGQQTPCLRDKKTGHRNQRLLEENCTILRRELAEMQGLCDDLSTSVIAAASLAPHGNGAKDLLDETIARMTQRAKRKVSGGVTAHNAKGER